jgi:hypothetical protein
VWDNPSHTGTPLVSLAVGTGITLDNTAKTITVKFETVGVAWTAGYYELTVVDSLSGSTATKTLLVGTINIQ